MKITHRTQKDRDRANDIQKRVTRVLKQIVSYPEQIDRMLEKSGALHGVEWQSAEPEALKEQRDRLVLYIRKGMLERKDMEIEIIVLASLIYANRTDQRARYDFSVGDL